jgi:hypothetical protein
MRFAALVLLGALGCGGKPATTTTPTAPPITAEGTEPKPVAPEAPPAKPAVDICAGRPEFGPVTLDETQLKLRYGQNAKTYADAPTTKEKPIEVCGIPASRQWLRGTTCADGSTARQNGRTGSVGAGGRCGSIIDLYSVTCPEGTIEVFIDIYMCGANESPH